MFYYHIEFWDDEDNVMKKESGLVGATSYNEAMEKVTDYFGGEHVYSITIDEWENILSEDEILEGFEHNK